MPTPDSPERAANASSGVQEIRSTEPHSKSTLRARILRIPLRASLRQASFHRTAGASIVVEVQRGGHLGIGEGCPRPYQTGEDEASALAWIHVIAEEALRASTSLEGLHAFIAARSDELDRHPAAFCALELALLDLLAREAHKSLEELLALPAVPRGLAYTLILSDDALDVTGKMLQRAFLANLRDFKIKLGKDLDRNRDRLRLLYDTAPFPLRVRLDANNLWGDDIDAAIAGLKHLDRPFVAVEEPLSPRCPHGLARIARALGTRIVLDESLCTLADVALFEGDDELWIANLKVSRCGGLLRTLPLMDRVKQRGFPVIVGAQAGETSILTRAGIALAAAAGDSRFAMEGAMGELLLLRDPVRPVLQFGSGGALDWGESGVGPLGFGLTMEGDQALENEGAR